jgi:hypothetical protein
MRHSIRTFSAPALAQWAPQNISPAAVAALAACSALATLGCSSDYALGDLPTRELGAVADGTQAPVADDAVPDDALAETALTDRALPGSLATPELTFDSELEGPSSAELAAAIGDLDGDGYGDLATLGYDSATYTQFVHVRYGGPRPVGGDQAFAFAQGGARLVIPTASGYAFALTHHISPAGDLDGDGYADFLVSLAACEPTVEGEGVYLLYGGAERLSGSQRFDTVGVYLKSPRAAAEISGSVSCSRTNQALGLGDFDGDGFDDFVVHDPQNWNIDTFPAITRGPDSSVYLFYGRQARLVSGADWLSADARLKANQDLIPSVLGDVDADGLADFMLGSSSRPVSHFALTGRPERLSGDVDVASVAIPMRDWVPRATISMTAGTPLAGPDVDGDGTSDLILLSLMDGHQYLFYGRTGLLAPDLVAESGVRVTNELEANLVVATAGDRDGDGDSDLLSTFGYDFVGPRVAFVGGSRQRFSDGVVFPVRAVVEENPSGALLEPDRYPDAVALAGDLDGDGASDIITSSSQRIPGDEPGEYFVERRQLHIHYGVVGSSQGNLRRLR